MVRKNPMPPPTEPAAIKAVIDAMALIEDHAVCIRSHDYSETSQVVTLFTRAHGKIRALAKGARRPKSKFGQAIEVLTAATVLFSLPPRDSALATLAEFDLSEPFPLLRRRLLALHCAQYAADLLARFTEELDPHERLYDAFYALLDGLQHAPDVAILLVRFQLALLDGVGLTPIWDHCCICRGPLGSCGPIYFSSSSGGMLCRDCEPAVMDKRFVDAKALALLQAAPLDPPPTPTTVLQAHELLSYHERELLGKESTIMVFLNRLLHQQVRKGLSAQP